MVNTDRRRRRTSDPLLIALEPPANESPVDRETRIKAEQDARKVSEGIDNMLQQERDKSRKGKPEVKVLLLGQSESGKSTTLKQFQLLHTPSAFHAERLAWRTVIYLNLVRSITRILEALAPESDGLEEHGEDADPAETASIVISSEGRSLTIPNYESYHRRLSPLFELEDRLIALLSSPDEEEATRLVPMLQGYTPPLFSGIENRPLINGRLQAGRPTIVIPDKSQTNGGTSQSTRAASGGKAEVVVHPRNNWKRAFALGGNSKSPKSAHSGEIEGWWEDPNDPVHELHACSTAMIELWRDPNVKKRLNEKRLRLEESSGFYLDEISRITAKKYIPTDSDVLKARLKTMGVVEHSFNIPGSRAWRIYDVGGSRNQRQAWAPYFMDVNAIIFLAPISAFDQNPNVNRLDDSIMLWKHVVSNKLLEKVSIILFLNKVDLLQAKVDAGVRLVRYMPSYGNRPNDYHSISRHLKVKFITVHNSYTTNKDRQIYWHFTAVTDTSRTGIIISGVQDIIIKTHLRNMQLV